MSEQLEQDFTKKVTKLPDGRQLIYYNFTPETGTTIPTDTAAQPEKEER